MDASMNIKRNELKMMERRGYDVTKAYMYAHPDVNPFTGGVNELALQELVSNYGDNLSMVYPKLNTNAIVLYLPVERGKTRKGADEIVFQAVNQTVDGRPKYSEYIFISGDLTPAIRKNLTDLRINVTMFTYREMSIDLFSHVTAPISVKWWTDVETFHEDEEIKDSELSQVSVNDPYIKRIGLKKGYIVMAVLPAIDGGNVVDYRVVV